MSGVDVRILTQNDQPDQKLPYFAARYHWQIAMEAGIRIFQYQPGMMHSKMILVDHRLASVGTANLDERSLRLNFELNCIFYSRHEIRLVESIFDRAFNDSFPLGDDFLARGLPVRILENCARLFSPVL
jgi:cardiolipin synthase